MTGQDDGRQAESEPGQIEDDREARVRALSNLARVDQAPGSEATTATATLAGALNVKTRRHPRRKALLLLCGLLLIAALASGGMYAYQRVHANDIPGQLTINLAAAGGGCPSAFTWSPDGKLLAVMVAGADCAHQQADTSTLLIYNARNGKLARRIDLTSVLQAQRLSPSADPQWSPDGQWLSVAVIETPTSNAQDNRAGVLLLPATGGQSRLLTGPLVIDPKTYEQTDLDVWDAHASADPQAVALPLPMAATYSWTADGGIAPASTSGDPVTSAERNLFSPWQNGILRPLFLYDDAGQPAGAPLEIFQALDSYWSSDSHYVSFSMSFVARVAADPAAISASQTQMCLARYQVQSICEAPIAAPLDTAFASILAKSVSVGADDAAAGTAKTPIVPLAWRPDGQFIATILPGNGTVFGNHTIAISLYPSDAQHPSATLTLPRKITSDVQGVTPLAWSPTGQQLAAADPLGNTVVIWGPGKLPK